MGNREGVPLASVDREEAVAEDTPFQLGNFAIDDPRPMKVVVIGAGYSGVIAGIRFRQYIPNLDLTIYDANAGVGGTWYSNKYPGLACDTMWYVLQSIRIIVAQVLNSFRYQPTFAPNPNWSKFYVPGPEIREHIENMVEKWKLMPYIKLRHRLVHAQWDEAKGKWMLTIRVVQEQAGKDNAKPEDAIEFQDTADVLFTGFGMLSRWSWPDIEGLRTFKGPVIHSAQWETVDGAETWEDSVKNWGDKRVGVIGVGSSGIQIVPALQPRVGKLVNFVRGKTWISGTFASNTLQALAGTQACDNYEFTQADKERFQDPVQYMQFRRGMEMESNAAYAATLRGSEGQLVGRKELREIMERKLAKKPWIAKHLIPEFGLGCRRLTPGPGYLEALCEDNVDFVASPIKRVTENGVVTEDGTEINLDILICATGYDTSFQLGFPFIGKGGVDLKDKYTPHPRTYLAVAVDGFPNWFQSFGPNSGGGSGSLTATIEAQIGYAVKATAKLQRERLKSLDVKKEAVDDFDEYLEAFFPNSVFSETCKSWYKNGKAEGRIWALWPAKSSRRDEGSTLHFVRALEHPRWEDFSYEPLEKMDRNRFYWLGNGATGADMDPAGNKAFYLDNIDVPPVPDAHGASPNRDGVALAQNSSGFRMGNFAVDEPRRMKGDLHPRDFRFVVIGAGYSGIIAGIRFRQHIQNLDLKIYEANAGVGGTWYTHKYPGLACDIPGHAYQPTFDHNPDWSQYYASGAEVGAYLEHIVDKWKLMPYIKLRHRLVRAEWSDESGKWLLTFQGPDGAKIRDVADVLFTAVGMLRRWSWPDISGLRAFGGPVIHSAQWETGLADTTWEQSVKGWANKRVGVIGTGSSALQIVPALQPHVDKLVNFARGKTWVTGSFGASVLQNLTGQAACDNYTFSDEDKRKFHDAEEYRKFRRDLEREVNSAFKMVLRDSEVQVQMREQLTEVTKKRLEKKPWIADHLIPEFGVSCRRPTPGPGYLEALCEDNVDFVPFGIQCVTKDAVITEDGQTIPLDIIVCATGYDTTCKLDFPLIGRGGVDLSEKYEPYPQTYLGLTVDGFPNWFQSFGPNGAPGAGSLVLVLEKQVDYAVKATAKLQRERLKSMDVKKEAVNDFDEYLEAFFPTTVYVDSCKSWYKNREANGRIRALWPGSSLHIVRALEHPRWEDYSYEPLDGTRNRFHWFGHGGTVADMDPTRADRAFYMDNIDYPPIPE
uniref:FAD/NAD(P)-binding domain-containing protein n=1 Tax=Schizophyllum commune (strain H4-8 / FGSC 9210) TaxID=578458 RepID=D8PMF7_SCHCM